MLRHVTFQKVFGKSKLQVPDTGTSQYWWILEHFWCTSIAWKCDIYILYNGVIQNLTILELKNGLVLSNTRVPVSGTSSILFPVSFPTLTTFTYKTTKQGIVTSL